MIVFACPTCGQKLKTQDDWAGKKVQCAGCKGILQVPAAPPPSPPEQARLEADTPTLATPAPGGPKAQGDTDADLRAASQEEREQYSFLGPPLRQDELGRLGRYRILKVLGIGGMGIVFEGEDVMLRRPVALKAMLPRVAVQDNNRRRFLREAQSTAALEHDHIVTIYEVGEVQGIPFLAMALLRGEALDQRLRHISGLPLADVLRIGREIAQGLAAAHERGLIHRDIKPANIWLEGSRGRVKILDFGLARASEDQMNLTQVGDLLGTPAYMSPEQASGGTIDHRCDLFSLGSVLYQMATGELPFNGPNAIHVVMAVATMNPPPIEQLAPDLPPELCTLIMRLLSKKPADRPQSAQEVAEALEAIESLYTTRPPSTADLVLQSYRAPAVIPTHPIALPPARRWPRAAALFIVLVLLLGAACWAILYFLGRERPVELFVLGGRRGVVHTIAFSPNGKMLAAGTKDWAILLWNPDTGKEIQTLNEAEAVNGLAFSPLEPYFLASACSDNMVRVWNPATGATPLLLKGHTMGVRAVAYSPDGKNLASGSWDKTVRTWDARDGKALLTLSQHTKNVTGVAFHPKKNILASCSKDKTIRLWDLSNGEELKVLSGHAGEVTGVAFSPDGKYLASSSLDKTVRIWEVDTGLVLLVLPGHTGGVNGVAYSPDGKRLASAGSDRTVRLWDVAAKKELNVLQGHEAEVTAVAFSPDGKRLASASLDGTVRVWQVSGS